jgi:hypothetical protein
LRSREIGKPSLQGVDRQSSLIPENLLEISPIARIFEGVSLSVPLGANMPPIPATVFANPDVRLRVWFNDGDFPRL